MNPVKEPPEPTANRVPRSELRRCPALDDVDDRVLDALAALCHAARFSPDQPIVPLIETAPRFHFVLDGLAKLVATTHGGIERIVYVYRPCEVIGSRYLSDGGGEGEYPVMAMTTVRTAAVDRDRFLRLAEVHPELVLGLAAVFSARLEALTRRTMASMSVEAAVRLSQLLLDFADGGPPSDNGDGPGRIGGEARRADATDGDGFVGLTHPLTHRTMAQIIGASRPHTSALLAELENRGAVLRVAPGAIRIRKERLDAIVNSGQLDREERAS